MKLRAHNWMCSICGVTSYVKLSQVGRKKCCSTNCTKVLFRDMFSGAGNPAYGRTYRSKASHPEWAQSISQTQKASGSMLGDKNPMRRAAVASKMSRTRRDRVTSDPVYRRQRSEYMKQAWANGKYDDVSVGMCKWYDHVKPDGTIVKCQGTWEVALARRLDELVVAYVPHRGRWSYTTSDGSEHMYYPDFYVPMWDAYVDVKGSFWSEQQAQKFDYIRASNPDKLLILATENVLRSWNVRLKETQHELLSV